MNELDEILVQLDRTRFQPKSGQWLRLPELKSDSDFPDIDAVPHEVHTHASTSNLSFSTIMGQIQKKKPSKKSAKERIADKSVLLANRLGQTL